MEDMVQELWAQAVITDFYGHQGGEWTEKLLSPSFCLSVSHPFSSCLYYRRIFKGGHMYREYMSVPECGLHNVVILGLMQV